MTTMMTNMIIMGMMMSMILLLRVITMISREHNEEHVHGYFRGLRERRRVVGHAQRMPGVNRTGHQSDVGTRNLRGTIHLIDPLDLKHSKHRDDEHDRNALAKIIPEDLLSIH